MVSQQVATEASAVPRTHLCPQCSETFPTAATLEAHKRGHAGGWQEGGPLGSGWPVGDRMPPWAVGRQQAVRVGPLGWW